MYDIVIIGAGPAGLTAGIYGVRAAKKVLVLEKNAYGGQIINAQNIDNVGGIAGVNVGQINNSLAKVDIIAHDNVGGAVGYQYIEKEN